MMRTFRRTFHPLLPAALLAGTFLRAEMVCPDHAGVCAESPQPAATPASSTAPARNPFVDRQAPAQMKDRSQELSEYASSYREAAEKGQAEAQYHLGMAYRWGVGVAQDLPQGVEWIRRSAGQGYPTAERVLGELYAHGEGVPQSEAEAMRWYKRAAKHKDELAKKELAALEAKMAP